jgi:hypothetical protein
LSTAEVDPFAAYEVVAPAGASAAKYSSVGAILRSTASATLGTPSGVGFARKPPLFMKTGDVCEVEIEGIGTLVNPVIDEVV